MYTLQKLIWALAILSFIVIAGVPAIGSTPAGQDHCLVCLVAGTSADLPAEGIQRFVVGAPNLLSAERTDSGLHVTAKQPGKTALAVWTDTGYKSYEVRINTLDESSAAGGSVDTESLMTLAPGGSEVIRGKGITRAAVSDPEVADIVPVSTTEVLVNAKKEGIAVIRVWDEGGLTTYSLTVTKPGLSSEDLAAEITRQIGSPAIFVRVAGDSVVLSGSVPTADASQKAAIIAAAFGRKVINLITVEAVTAAKLVASLKAALPDENLTFSELPDETVMIRGAVPSLERAMEIQDVIKTWIGSSEVVPAIEQNSNMPSLGTNSAAGGPATTSAEVQYNSRSMAREVNPGDVQVKQEQVFARKVFGGRVPDGPRIVAMIDINAGTAKQVLVSALVLEIDRGKMKQVGLDWAQFAAGIATPVFSIFEEKPEYLLDQGGPIWRSPIGATVKALIEENAAKILSEPKLLITDGQAGNIVVGGEIPVPVAETFTSGLPTITIVFKTFGIQLSVRPKVTQDDRILMTLTPEVSSLDYENGVRTADIIVPAIRTRRATTTVHIGNSETLAIGGLLSSEDVKVVDRVPLLSKIPIIGELFKSRRFATNQTELVILVTPQVVPNGIKPAIATPGEAPK